MHLYMLYCLYIRHALNAIVLGCDMDEDSVSAGQSHSNTLEANVVQQYVRRLLASGLTQENIGIITPYNGQVDVLRLLLHEEFPSLEIRTVDGFQGGEKEGMLTSSMRCFVCLLSVCL